MLGCPLLKIKPRPNGVVLVISHPRMLVSGIQRLSVVKATGFPIGALGNDEVVVSLLCPLIG